MNYTDILHRLADEFLTRLHHVSDLHFLPTEDFGWENYRFTSPIFRLAHVERYTDNKVDVLHVTTFPHAWCPDPIFGFDIIATQNAIIGCYMDFSPVSYRYPFLHGMEFHERKPTPEWATIFSDEFIALKPKDDEEFSRFSHWALTSYDKYITLLKEGNVGNSQDIIEKQNRYCSIQASNPRTFTVLKHKIGEARAQHFMQHILFPKITDEWPSG